MLKTTITSTAGPGNTSSLATPSPGPNVVSPSTLGFKPETVTDLSADPEGNLNQRDPLKPAELPTTNFPRVPTEAHSVDFHADEMVIGRDNVSSVFENDTTIYINATETFFLDFPHATTNVSAEPEFLASAATAETPHMALTTRVQPDDEYQELNATSGNKHQQKQKKMKESFF